MVDPVRGMGARITLRWTIAFLTPFCLFAVFLAINHLHPIQLYGMMWSASFGSVMGFSQVVIKATPFILTAVATALPARVGLVNVGGEGQLTIGALGSTWIAVQWLTPVSPWLGIPCALLAGAAGGALWAAIAAFLRQFGRMNETITTLLLNYVAAFVVGFFVNGPLKDPTSLNWPVSPALPNSTLLPQLGTSQYNIGIFISLCIVFTAWTIIAKTRLGFRVRVVGGNALAARQSGIPVAKFRFWTFVIAGAVAGIAGMLVVTGDDGRLYTTTGVNFGYYGFLAAWVGSNRLLAVVPAALLIAAISVAGNSLEISSNLPSATVQVLMALILFAILAQGGLTTRERTH